MAYNHIAAKNAATWTLAALSGGWMSSLIGSDAGKPHIANAEASPQRTVMSPVATNSSPMSPTLPIRVIRPNRNLEIAYDVRLRNAVYVMEKVDRDGQNLGKGHKRPNFYEEAGIPHEAYRSRLSHYRNSGYDRGHLAPAADFPQQTEDTYNLCNVSPQNHQMNMSIWCKIEEFVRRVADRTGDDCETYVVTGPLWLPVRQISSSEFEYSYSALGTPPSLVAVPTHFFKVVAVVSKLTSIVQFACFVVPNSEPNKDKQMQDYLVAWTDLERVTGLQFFPRLATEEWKEWADQVTRDTITAAKSQQLLLTDGSSSGSRKLWKRTVPATLQHLCKGGECR